MLDCQLWRVAVVAGAESDSVAVWGGFVCLSCQGSLGCVLLVTRAGGRDLHIIYDLIPGTLGDEKAIGRADRGWKMGGTAWGC
jgi:hypothetical protein